MSPKAYIFDSESEKVGLLKEYFLAKQLIAEKISDEDVPRWNFKVIVSGSGTKIAEGYVYGQKASICVGNNPLEIAEKLGLSIGQVVFITETKHTHSGSVNMFTLSGEKARKAARTYGVEYSTAINRLRKPFGRLGKISSKESEEKTLRNLLYQLFANYGKHFDSRLSLGMRPWGAPKGMRGAPKKADTSSVLSTFAFPFPSSDMYKPNGENVNIHIVLCPNYNQDRTDVTAFMLPHKVESYVNSLSGIVRNSSTVGSVSFYSLNGGSLREERFRRLLNPKVLSHPCLDEHLDNMFEAYADVFVKGLCGVTNVAIRPLQEVFPVASDWLPEHAELLDSVTAEVIASSPAATGISHEENKERVKSDLLLTMALAGHVKKGDVVLDTKYHLKSYWEPIFPAVQKWNPHFSLFLLPGYYSHNMAYE